MHNLILPFVFFSSVLLSGAGCSPPEVIPTTVDINAEGLPVFSWTIPPAFDDQGRCADCIASLSVVKCNGRCPEDSTGYEHHVPPEQIDDDPWGVPFEHEIVWLYRDENYDECRFPHVSGPVTYGQFRPNGVAPTESLPPGALDVGQQYVVFTFRYDTCAVGGVYGVGRKVFTR